MRSSLRDRFFVAFMGLALVLSLLGLVVDSAIDSETFAARTSDSAAEGSAERARSDRDGRDGHLDLSHGAGPTLRLANGARPRADARSVDAIATVARSRRLRAVELEVDPGPRHVTWRRSARVSPSRMRADLMVFLI